MTEIRICHARSCLAILRMGWPARLQALLTAGVAKCAQYIAEKLR
jgi:hypothetical protein